MTYEVALAPAAARQLRKFDPPVPSHPSSHRTLATEPRPPAATRLVVRRWRVGSPNR